MGSVALPNTVRVAVTQAEPMWLDLEGAVEKTCKLIEEAASNGAAIVTFPECWIPGYPAWIWSRSVDFDLGVRYLKSSLQLESPQMDRIRACAASSNITVALSYSENFHNSAYIAQSLIGNDGTILLHRRKIKPTHMERTVFGDGAKDSLDNVANTGIGRVGMLSCWEHTQPLLKYHTYLQRELFHVGAWPPLFDHAEQPHTLWSMSRQGAHNLSQTYAIESQSFVLHTTAILDQRGIDIMRTESGALFNKPGGGSSAVFGPDGRKLTEDLPENTEGIVYADLETDAVLRAKSFIDVCGHYSRPDLLWLGVVDYPKKVEEEGKTSS